MNRPIKGMRGRYRHTCPFCMRQFQTGAALSMHRVGSYAERTVHCLGDSEMRAHGLEKNEHGVYRLIALGANA